MPPLRRTSRSARGARREGEEKGRMADSHPDITGGTFNLLLPELPEINELPSLGECSDKTSLSQKARRSAPPATTNLHPLIPGPLEQVRPSDILRVPLSQWLQHEAGQYPAHDEAAQGGASLQEKQYHQQPPDHTPAHKLFLADFWEERS